MTNRDIWSWLFPKLEYNPVTVILDDEAIAETRHDWSLAWLVVLPVFITATANVLQLWMSPTIAWGISTLGWTLLVYWFPSKLRVPFLKWIFLSLLFALATSLLAAVL